MKTGSLVRSNLRLLLGVVLVYAVVATAFALFSASNKQAEDFAIRVIPVFALFYLLVASAIFVEALLDGRKNRHSDDRPEQ